MSAGNRALRREIVSALFKALDAHPELRVCQLVVNATGRNDPYYVEDAELLELLRAYRISVEQGQ